MTTKQEQDELLQDMNEEICKAMLRFCKTQKGRLTEDRNQEFAAFVSDEVSKSAQAFLYTSLEMITAVKIKNYAKKMAGEFYINFYKQGKEKMGKSLSMHINAD